MDPTIVKTFVIATSLVLLLVVLPIVMLLLEHQRKMAKLMRGEKTEEHAETIAMLLGSGKYDAQTPALEARVTALEAEVAALRSSLVGNSTSPPPLVEEPTVRELLS